MRAHASPIAALLFALMCACATAQAAPLDDARALLRKGEHAQALQQVDLHLSTNPEDTQARFLKGIILTEQGDRNGAIKVFRNLTQRYPELPEPYNNLAVLYAQGGDYLAARSALEMAVRVSPGYATAYENLGDVYAVLAAQAYEKTLSLDGSNRNARAKLALARDLSAYAPPAPTAQPATPAPAPAPARPAAQARPANPSSPAFKVSPDLIRAPQKSNASPRANDGAESKP